MDITLPNGKIIRGVPEGTSKEAIMQKAISSGLATEQDFVQTVSFKDQPTSQQLSETAQQDAFKSLALEQGPIDTAMIAAGKGVMDIGRAVGLVDEASEVEKQAYGALKEESPITTGVGEALPYVAAAVPAGGLSLAPRVAAMTGLGAAELGIPSLAEGEDVSTTLSKAGVGGVIAGTLEAVFPLFGRLLGNAYRKLTGTTVTEVFDQQGKIIPEVSKVLRANNIDIDQIKGTAVSLVEKIPKNAAEAEKIARFKEQGMPFTPGDISGDFSQRAKEARLLEIQDEPMAEGLRQLRTEQASNIDFLKEQLVETLGDADTAGEMTKLGLLESKKALKENRKQAYSLLAEKAGMSGGIPIPQEKILATIYDDPDFAGMLDGLSSQESQQLSDLMVKYGVDTEQEAIEDYLSRNVSKGIFGRGKQIAELTTANAEDLSKALNSIISPTSSPALKGVIGKIKSGVDKGFDLIDDAIFDTAELVGLKQVARKSHIDLMQEFGKGGVVNKLIQAKPDGISQVVEASNVFNELFKPGRTNTIEQVKKVTAQLSKTTKGKKALGDLQAAFVLDVLDKGFLKSDKINGQVLFQGNVALNRIESLGMAEAKELFKSNPKAFGKLKALLETGVDITPSKKEVLKGSAGLIANIAAPFAQLAATAKFGMPMGVVNAISKISQSGSDKKLLKQLFKNNPKLVKHANFIKNDLPNIAVILGLSQMDDNDG